MLDASLHDRSTDDPPGGENNSEFRAVLLRASQGDAEAVSALINDYGHFIVRSVRRYLNRKLRTRYDTEDFVQAAWATIFEHRDRLAGINAPEQLIGYLLVVTSRKVMLECRRNAQQRRDINRERSLSEENAAAFEPAAAGATVSQQFVAKELWDLMTQGLSERDCTILERRSSGATIDEIAEQLDVNERTVRRVLERVWDRLEV